jgi:membrane glycosyltransferase
MIPEEDKVPKDKGRSLVTYVGGALLATGAVGFIVCLILFFIGLGEGGGAAEMGVLFMVGFGVLGISLIIGILGFALFSLGKGKEKKKIVPSSEVPVEHKPITTTKPSSPESVASLILGVAGILFTYLSIVFIGSILGLLGIVFGVIELVKLKRNPQLRGRGMAVAGLMLGIIAMIGLILEAVHFAIHV